MQMGEYKLNTYSIAEYIALESSSNQKFEYFNGWIQALAGGTINHGIICTNVSTALQNAVLAKDCIAINSEVKIYIERANSFVYPDAMVICNGIQTHDLDKNAVTNPTLIVEVLSDSTAKSDMGDKFFKYRMVDSFREYVVIRQDTAIVETFYREENGNWRISSFIGLDKDIQLHSIDKKISMSQVYLNVNNLQPPQFKTNL